MKNVEEHEIRHKNLFAVTSTAMAVLNEDDIITFINTELEKVTGFSTKEVIGREWREMVHSNDLKMIEGYHETLRKNTSWAPLNYDFRLIGKKGEIHTIDATVGLMPGSKSLVISMIDLTEIKLAQEKAQEHQKELEKKSFDLKEANTTIKVLMKYREEDKIEMEEKIFFNIDALVKSHAAVLS